MLETKAGRTDSSQAVNEHAAPFVELSLYEGDSDDEMFEDVLAFNVVYANLQLVERLL